MQYALIAEGNAMKIKNIFITGAPGVGKTTLLQKVVADISQHLRCGGFMTAEIRHAGSRVGFEVCSLDGRRTILAHRNFKTDQRVGRYGVDVSGFERFVLPLLDEPTIQLYLIDEIGKMECFSDIVCRKVESLLDSETPVLGSIAQKGEGFIRRVKMRRDVDIIEITRSNRDMLIAVLSEKVMHLVIRHAV